MSAHSGGQPVTPSRGGGIQGMSTHCGGQTVMPSLPHGLSIHSKVLPVMPSRDEATQDLSTHWSISCNDKCRGCDYDKSSLRGHLARTTKGCKKLYSEVELQDLAEQAEAIRKEKTANWKKNAWS